MAASGVRGVARPLLPAWTPDSFPAISGAGPMVAPARPRDTPGREEQDMTTRFAGHDTVPGGWYLNPLRLAIVAVPRGGGRLPEGEGSWRRVSALTAFALAPVLGALFVVALPVGVVALLAAALAAPTLRLLRGGTGDLAATLTPGWAPGEVHLTGRRAHAIPARFAPDARLDALAREIAARRGR
jgi:hypothetical protein